MIMVNLVPFAIACDAHGNEDAMRVLSSKWPPTPGGNNRQLQTPATVVPPTSISGPTARNQEGLHAQQQQSVLMLNRGTRRLKDNKLTIYPIINWHDKIRSAVYLPISKQRNNRLGNWVDLTPLANMFHSSGGYPAEGVGT
ncbi:hypothetical protein H6P81_018271 [Aristolochia fimbriata]|uniref:Uncharacterized protein n=1 Tax=Aristolochia fimbriata TaxID=158543 RepID=A0AAV7E0X5_ARIFI|nr:hypothetical protein H6P81_018271 [Aristolochia fimbriata]